MGRVLDPRREPGRHLVEQGLLAGDRRTRAALAAALLAPFLVATIRNSQEWQAAILVSIAFAGWAVLRTPTRRVLAIALFVVALWAIAFAAAALGTDDNAPIGRTPTAGVVLE